MAAICSLILSTSSLFPLRFPGARWEVATSWQTTKKKTRNLPAFMVWDLRLKLCYLLGVLPESFIGMWDKRYRSPNPETRAACAKAKGILGCQYTPRKKKIPATLPSSVAHQRHLLTLWEWLLLPSWAWPCFRYALGLGMQCKSCATEFYAEWCSLPLPCIQAESKRYALTPLRHRNSQSEAEWCLKRIM